MKNFKRRKFISTISAVTTGSMVFPLKGLATQISSMGKEDSFSFLFLGDMHYDKFEHHDVQYMKENYPNDIRQVINYSHLTWETMPELMRTTKTLANKMDAAFFLQLGDFLEGLCGSKELATKQANDFIQFIADQELKRPFIVTKGNHDITGIGAPEVYDEIILPWQDKELPKQVTSSNVTFVYKNARFIIFDGYKGTKSLDWLKDVLKNHKEDHLFFCVHAPVVPYNARSTWHIYNRDPLNREELINLLGKHNAIVFCGHLHKYSVLVRNTPNGNFLQVAIGSVIPASDTSIKDHLEGVENYNTKLVDLEPQFSPTTLNERKEVLENEAPHIRHFEYANFCGYGTVKVSSNAELEMSIFANTEQSPWTIVNLTKLLRH